MKALAAAGFALACLAVPPAAAQAPERGSAEAIEAVRQAVRSDKRGLVAKNLSLTDAEAKAFWPLYDTFQKDLDKILQRNNRAVLDYVNQESTMTDANASRLAREVMAANAEEQKLVERHYKRVRAVLPAKKAVRYMQIENKIRILQRYDTAAQVPLLR